MRRRSLPARAGFTLVELVVAAGLLTILLVVLFNLVNGFVGLWNKSEERRSLVEKSTAVTELLARDLEALEPGERGDLLAEWVLFDTDGDGVAESKWPRLRLVRHASPRDIALLQAGQEVREVGEGLVEVIWTVLPELARDKDADRRGAGLAWRGERLYGSARGPSIFDAKFLSNSGRPAAGAVDEVAEGVLWLSLTFAAQTSDVEAWKLGAGLGSCQPNWDAWAKGRPDAERHPWNEAAGAGAPPYGRPQMPRRVRIELELEGAKERLRRTRLARLCEPRDGTLVVDDGARLPVAPRAPSASGTLAEHDTIDAYVRVDAEWMKVVGVSGGQMEVVRGARGTQPALHDRGAMVHWGLTQVREVPIGAQQEDWNL